MDLINKLTKFFREANKVLFKLSIVVLMASLLLVPQSSAFFTDLETSTDNLFAATFLDLGYQTDTDFSPADLIPGDSTYRTIFWQQRLGLPFLYSQEYEYLAGNDSLCNLLELKVVYKWYDSGGILQEAEKYNDLLSSFSLNVGGTDPEMAFPSAYDYYPNLDYSLYEQWYEYRVSLPEDLDPSFGNQTCQFNILAKAWMEEYEYGVAFYDTEKVLSSIDTGSWAKVSGMKFEDANGNSIKDEGETGLEGWKIFAALEQETLSVNSGSSDPVTSLTVLESGESYLIRATGTFDAGDSITADAKYSVREPNTEWTDYVQNYEGYGPELLDLQIGDTSPDWGEYNELHEYWLTVEGEDAALDFKINDIYYPNNVGLLEVTIFKVEVEDITDVDGNYELDITGIDGEFIVLEELQEGWQQTWPEGGYYSFTELDIYENYDFGNKQIEDAPRQAGKIVINEVFYNVNEEHGKQDKNEWIELYNGTNTDIPLKDWKFVTSTGIEKPITTEISIPAHGFAVIAHDASTWHDWELPEGTITIKLTGNSTWLNDEGDSLTLFNSADVPVDYVAWEGENKWDLFTEPGESIARRTLGVDTDTVSDWEVLTTPNPGTNPHSHIQVALKQLENNLLIGFTNAWGFDSLKYFVTYSHKFEEEEIEEQITGEAEKELDDRTFYLPPIFIGTCSTDKITCIAHQPLDGLKIILIYKDNSSILGSDIINFPWEIDEENDL